MRKFLLYIIISNFISIKAIATNIKIDHEINTSFQCKFEKTIIKKVIKKIVLIFLLYKSLFLGTIIKKQLINAISGI